MRTLLSGPPRERPNATRATCGAVLAALCTLAPITVHAAGLTLGDQTAGLGQTILAAVSFSSEGQPVSGIQFDLETDGGLFLRVLPGPQIGASAKVLYSAALPNHALRVLMVGINQSVIGDGEVLRPVISVDANAALGPARVRITNAFATDPYGNEVVLRAGAAAVNIQPVTAGQPLSSVGVVNGASLLPGPVSPGEIVTVLGGPGLSATSAVLFNGVPAPILYAGPGQVNAIVPLGLDGNASARLDIRSPGTPLDALALTTAAASPAIFTQTSSGTGPGLILNEDYALNSFSNPANAGSVIVLFGTGFGPLTPAARDGETASGPASTATQVSAMVAGVPAEVLYAGAAPGLITGVIQVNVRVPKGIPANAAAPVSLRVGAFTTPGGVTVSIQSAL
jgi:uncharacterized protein (TIGR03437 family)